MGCFLSLIGSTVLVLHAPQEDNIDTMEELSAKLVGPGNEALIQLVWSYSC